VAPAPSRVARARGANRRAARVAGEDARAAIGVAELARAPRRIARATRRDATSDDEWRRRTASRLDSIKC
jgi:hypothetical protein